MDRNIVYPGQVPLDTDILSINRNAMISDGYILRACIGLGTFIDGLACLATVPASMQVTIGPGSIISTSVIDSSAFGTIAADLDPLVKMGINPFGSTTFTLTAPGTSGQTISYLIEAQLVETDGSPLALPYFNASNPQQPFTGPNNNQAQQNTVRTQRVGLQLKAGVAAAAGTQQTPGIDAGWVGLYVINVNFAQTTVTATSITPYAGAPFIGTKIPSLAPIASPNFINLPTAPTPPSGDASTRIATTAFITTFGHIANVSVFTSNGAFTVPANVTKLSVMCVGAGGGGGGTFNTGPSTVAASPGGSSGTWGWGTYNVTPGQVIPYVIGAPGSQGVANGANGGAGGTTAFGTLLTAPGGIGAFTVPATAVPFTFAAAPVTAISAGGLINGGGNSGQASIAFATGNLFGGTGGSGPFGGGGSQAIGSNTDAAGGNATAPGSGGGGAATSNSQLGAPGGFGGNGVIIVQW